MRRKSDRNKSKGSPEKKVEKPTRKSPRRRSKRETSSSPERDDSQDDTTSDASLSRESNKDSTSFQTKDLRTATEKSDLVISTTDVVEKDSSPETEDNGSVWKVARADASPGEIQKLKLCRQRNISETSDNSSCRKKVHKWQGSGEGTGGEVDSNDERLGSPRVEFSDKRPDDISSLSLGQDSNQEVSDYKETLPESTSANLSDDKPNIDLQGDTNEASCFILSNDITTEPTGISADHVLCGDVVDPDFSNQQETKAEENEEVYNQDCQQHTAVDTEFIEKEEEEEAKEEQKLDLVDETPFNTNLGKADPETDTDILRQQLEENTYTEEQVPSEEISETKEHIFEEDNSIVHEQVSPKDDIILHREESQIQEEKEEETLPREMEIVERDEGTPPRDQESSQRNEATSEKDDPNDSSSEEEQGKVHSDSNSIDEAQMNVRSSIRASSRSNRRKHRTKYRESSYSDTPESEDDPSLERESKQPETPEEEEEEPLSRDKDFHRDRSRSKSLEPGENSSLLNSGQRENKLDEENEKTENIANTSPSDILSEAITSSQKPAKINLKRTFGTRNSVDELKNEESSPCVKIDSNQVKTNHTNENPEQKRVPKRRRWGTTLSTDSSIEFSVSTDSLKVLVPGAKPLSITEVRLSKDTEEEQLRSKSRDKHVISDNNGEYVVREDTVASKSEGSRKGDTKADNHMGSRRKISVMKDNPQTMLPSSPAVKATNILLIKNLVRPFTLTQIKELLCRTGTIMENGFWMDRIKSKCFVEYSNEDQAFETRQALHGISWPLSNPKKLLVEYATKQDMELARESSSDLTNSRKDESHGQTDSWQHDWIREERSQAGVKVMVVREWDLGKEDGQQHVIKDERERKDMEKKKRQRSQTPATEIHLPAPARKFKKKEDEPPPAKLLDDLFRKTKATPSIYWLPLTNEQIVVKEEMRRQHMAEHARRLEEMRRAERNRDNRRRRTPRK